MDKVREQGAPLPGNDKENWGNLHTGIWRKREEEEKKKENKERRKWKKKRQKLKNFTEEEEHGDHGDDKLKSSKWGKLGWN